MENLTLANRNADLFPLNNLITAHDEQHVCECERKQGNISSPLSFSHIYRVWCQSKGKQMLKIPKVESPFHTLDY